MDVLRILLLLNIFACCVCDEFQQERLPRIGERLLVELDSFLNNRTEYKGVEKTLRKSLTNETKNAIRITINGGETVRSLADQIRVYLSVIDELLQELSSAVTLLYQNRDMYTCCSWACLGGGDGDCLCDDDVLSVETSWSLDKDHSSVSPREQCFSFLTFNLTAIFNRLNTSNKLSVPHYLFLQDIHGPAREFPSSNSHFLRDHGFSLVHQSVESKDLIIVLDRGLTMTGQPMLTARQTAKHLISQLAPKDSFNVLILGEDVQALMCSDGLVQATERNKGYATQQLDSVQERVVLARYREGLTEAFHLINKSSACTKAIVILTAGTLEKLDGVFDQFNSDKSVIVFAFLIGPPVEVASVREMGCHNNQGYYDNIVSVDEVEDKLLSVPRVLSRPLAAHVMRGEPSHYHCSVSEGGVCSKTLAFHHPIFGIVEGTAELVGVAGVWLNMSTLLSEHMHSVHKVEPVTDIVIADVSGQVFHRSNFQAANMSDVCQRISWLFTQKKNFIYEEVASDNLELPWVVAMVTTNPTISYVQWNTSNAIKEEIPESIHLIDGCRSCADISITSAFSSRISVEFQSESDAVTIATVLRDPFNISVSLGVVSVKIGLDNFTELIGQWISNYFRRDILLLLVDHSGYIVYVSDGCQVTGSLLVHYHNALFQASHNPQHLEDKLSNGTVLAVPETNLLLIATTDDCLTLMKSIKAATPPSCSKCEFQNRQECCYGNRSMVINWNCHSGTSPSPSYSSGWSSLLLLYLLYQWLV